MDRMVFVYKKCAMIFKKNKIHKCKGNKSKELLIYDMC